MNIFELLANRQKKMLEWESAIWKAGFLAGREYEQNLNHPNGAITGMLQESQVREQVEQILFKKRF